MREKIMNSTAAVFAVAMLVFLLLLTGCTTSTPQAAPVVTTTVPPVETTIPPTTVVPTPTVDQTAIDDKLFTDAADICYKNTPVITNLTTHLEFATCMKNTPLPKSNCALNYRYYVLKYTNEDASTAGFARETQNVNDARDAFLRGEGYDGIRQEYATCGNSTMIPTSFHK